jgi:hypothetical protein
MRGVQRGAQTMAEFETKFRDNALYGGWDRATADRFAQLSRSLFSQPRLTALQEFRA